jgi:hypothetical protein
MSIRDNLIDARQLMDEARREDLLYGSKANNWLGKPAGGPTGHERRFAWMGWNPVDTLHPCPLQILGKRCKNPYGTYEPSCICNRNDSLIDHARSWRSKKDRHVIYTSEPYWAPIDKLVKFAADLAEHDLSLDVLSASPWYPGHTVMLMVTHKDWCTGGLGANLIADAHYFSPSAQKPLTIEPGLDVFTRVYQ